MRLTPAVKRLTQISCRQRYVSVWLTPTSSPGVVSQDNGEDEAAEEAAAEEAAAAKAKAAPKIWGLKRVESESGKALTWGGATV